MTKGRAKGAINLSWPGPVVKVGRQVVRTDKDPAVYH